MRKYWDNSAAVGASVPSASLRTGPARATPVPAHLLVGDVQIAPATVLAPMAGVTDTVFRRFIRNLGGCGLIMTEFTSADGVLRKKDPKAKRYLHFYEDEHPISAQLFGSNPQVMAEAARMVEGLGFDLVDLNLGCPAKKVVKCNGGSGLLRDLPAIGEIFKAVRAAVKIPFTVKFRAGWNDEEIVCVELARMAEDCGLNGVALHARTREQGYSGPARWEWIAAVKDAVKIPVIGNGDIRTPEDACAMVAQTGCDAVMIGRTAPSNPWIFRQIQQYCAWIRDVHVGADAHVRPVERSSGSPETSMLRPQSLREGHDFSRAADVSPLTLALAAEGNLAPDRPVRSGAKAPESLAGNGTAEEAAEKVELVTSGAKARGDKNAAIAALKRCATPNQSSSAACEAVPFPVRAISALPYDQPTEADRYQMIRTYFSMLIEEEFPDAPGKMKQFASWFTHGVPGGAALRKAIYEAKTAPEILGRVEDFFESRLCGTGIPAREG